MEFELQRWKERYIPDLVKNGNYSAIAEMMSDDFPCPLLQEEAMGLIDTWLNSDDRRALCQAIIIDGEAVGGVRVELQDGAQTRTGELNFWLTPELWGNRIATRAVRLMCANAFDLFDIARIQAQPFAHNTAARCVLNKAGFSFEGTLRQSICKKGRVYDGCMYALLHDDLL